MIVKVPQGAPANTMPSVRQPHKGGRSQRHHQPQHSYRSQQQQHQQQQQAYHGQSHFPPPLSVAPVHAGHWNEPGGNSQRKSISNKNYNRHQIGHQNQKQQQHHPMISGQKSGHAPSNHNPANNFRLPAFNQSQGDGIFALSNQNMTLIFDLL